MTASILRSIRLETLLLQMFKGCLVVRISLEMCKIFDVSRLTLVTGETPLGLLAVYLSYPTPDRCFL